MMTNEQLRLLLEAMISEAEARLDETRSLMPDDAERVDESYWQYVGKGIGWPHPPNPGPPDWEWREEWGEYIALQPLAQMLAEWRERLAFLTPISHESERL